MPDKPHQRLTNHVLAWKTPTLQACGVHVGNCGEKGSLVGISLVAQDGTPIAHTHADPEVMEKVWRDIGDAIVTARTKRT